MSHITPAAVSSSRTLVWSGTDYVGTIAKSDVTSPKAFIGPTDPNTVSGVTLAKYDSWRVTSS